MSSRVNIYSGRNFFLIIILLVAFLLLFSRLIYIKTFQDSFLEERSYSKIKSIYQIPSRRGKILDRNGRILALDINSYFLEIDRLSFNLSKTNLSLLSEAINLDIEKIVQRINLTSSRYLIIKKDLDQFEIESLNKIKLKGVNILQKLKRSYPQGEAFSHVVGLTDTDRNGIQGTELVFDKFLKGKDGSFEGSRGPKGIKLDGKRKEAEDGRDLYLTIDSRLQSIAFLELNKIIEKTKAISGSVVIIDPRTSEILSLTNLPTFNPNNRKNISDLSVFRNRSALDIFEPGSVMKPLAMSAILESGLVKESELVNTSPGWIEYGGYKTSDFRDFGSLNLNEIISRSSNVAMVKLCDQQDKDYLFEYFSNFGLDSDLTNILIPATQGFLPKYSIISERDKVSFCYGYGLSISALHIAQAYSVFANRGMFKELYLYLDKDLSSLKNPKRVLSEDTASKVEDMLIETVNARYGTGRKAGVNGLLIAGKTGTAERIVKNEKEYTATFSGYSVARDPSLLIVVVLRGLKGELHSGGEVAAPAFSEIMNKSMRTLELGT